MRRPITSCCALLLAAATLVGCGGKTDNEGIGDAGTAVVGAALGAMDAPLPFETINVAGNELTVAGMRSIVP